MYKEHYIGDDTRVITREFRDRQACSVSYITTVEKRGSLGSWSLDDRKETYVLTDAEATHERIRKEQRQQKLERHKEDFRKHTIEELKRFNRDERSRQHERDRDYDRGYSR